MRIIENCNFDFKNNIKSFDEFTAFFANIKVSNSLLSDSLIVASEKLLDKSYPVLTAYDYSLFKKTGNRTSFENKYFDRRYDLLTLSLAEFSERKGRFFDAIINLVWMISEETSWVVPAHYWMVDNLKSLPDSLLSDNAKTKEVIDLFSAVTASELALVYGLFYNQLSLLQPAVLRRIELELDRRIWQSVLDFNFFSKLWWTGCDGNKTNNWCPWIIANLLTTCAFSVKNSALRENLFSLLTPILDNFIDGFADDGACDEGPSYWEYSVGMLFNCFELLHIATDGKFNLLNNPFLKKMADYIFSVHIDGFNFLSLSDSPPYIHLDVQSLSRFAIATNSDKLFSLSNYLFSEEVKNYNAYRVKEGFFYNPKDVRSFLFGRTFNSLQDLLAQPFICSDFDFSGAKREFLKNLQVFCARNNSNGFFLALNGGNNAQSHNHNDLGNVTVLFGNTPILVDVGSGNYTKRSFDFSRYTLWNTRSDGHNLPDLNGKTQQNGKQFFAENFSLSPDNNGCFLSLTNAYPVDAGLSCYNRYVCIDDYIITITDNLKFKNFGNAVFHFICIYQPVLIDSNKIKIANVVLTFDPSLCFTFETLDCSSEEYSNIPDRWNTENIYRINLKSGDFTDKQFVFYLDADAL